MKNVLFIDKGSNGIWPSYLSLSTFLEGWHRRGLFEVCSWRPSAYTVRAAVPSLASILGDEQDWQAIIVCDLRDESGTLADDPHFDNPFDFPENYSRDIDGPVEESEHPVVRLCQMLGGIPDKVRLDELGGDGRGDTAVQLSYPQSEQYYDFLERYRTNLPRPKRIICVSPRLYDDDIFRSRSRELMSEAKEEAAAEVDERLDNDDEIKELLDRLHMTFEELSKQLHAEYDAQAVEDASPKTDTSFWERNDYPANARFVVYDWPLQLRLDEEATGTLGDEFVDPMSERRIEQMHWLSFWTGVLTLLTANFDSAELRPYRLYRIEPKFTAEDVRDAVSERWSEWLGARKQIEDQIEIERRRLHRSEFEEQEIPDCETQIPVHFDVLRSELRAKTAEVGIYRDIPRPDLEMWAEHQRDTLSALRALLRAPRRAMDRAVRAFRSKSIITEEELEYCVLTESQCLDLKDDLVAEEYVLAETTGRRAFREKSHTEAFETYSDAIVDRIMERPPTEERRLAVLTILGGAALGLLAVLPAMIDVEEARRSTIGVAVGSSILPCLLIVLFLVLQRKAIRDAYEALNGWLRSVAALLEAEAVRLSKRLSLYAQVRKEWTIIRKQEHLSQSTMRGRWLGERLALMTHRMSSIVSVIGEPKRDLSAYSHAKQLPWSETTLLLEDESFFDASPSVASTGLLHVGTGENCETSDPGSVVVPFSFVRSITLEALRIH